MNTKCTKIKTPTKWSVFLWQTLAWWLMLWRIQPPHPTKIKTPPFGGIFISGGSGWIRTSSGLSQQIYSLPRLSNSGARPNLFATTFMARHTKPWRSVVRAAGNRAYKNTMSCVISNELMFASQGCPIQLLSPYLLVRAAGIEPAFQAWKACILAFVLCPQQIQSPTII